MNCRKGSALSKPLLEEIEQARVQGATAHRTGIDRVPARDPAVMKLIGHRPVGAGGAEILTAWLAGWDKSNLEDK